MALESTVADHYSNSNLIDKIYQGLEKLGVNRMKLTPQDLSMVDDFHIGGTEGTDLLVDHLSIDQSSNVLDVGCGIGGPARFIANLVGCRVTGIDLTSDFVNTGNELTNVVGLTEQVELVQGSALKMPFSDERFDVSYMIHVGMNIEDKKTLMAEAFRVTKPGGKFGIYDVMLTSPAEISYPLPWAETEEGNAIANPETYKNQLVAAGFTITHEEQKTEFAINFFNKVQAAMGEAGEPPPLGLHLLMGPTAKDKVANVFKLIQSGVVAPIIIVSIK